MSRFLVAVGLAAVVLASAMPGYCDHGPKTFLGPFRFATLDLLPKQVAKLHIDAYARDNGRPQAEPCPVKVQFVSEEVVLQEGNFTLLPNRTLDVAFYGPATGVVEMHPVITPTGTCNLDIVPLLQIEEQLPEGTGKTLYIYSGQYSVPLLFHSEHH